MTEPTDDELAKLFTEETGFDVDDFPAAILDFARAARRSWGQPSGAGEPVAGLEILLAEVRKDDDALIRQMLSAMDAAQTEAQWGNAYGRCDTSKFNKCMEAARARLLDSDLSNLTERGANAWAGVDAQGLREGEPHGIPPTT